MEATEIILAHDIWPYKALSIQLMNSRRQNFQVQIKRYNLLYHKKLHLINSPLSSLTLWAYRYSFDILIDQLQNVCLRHESLPAARSMKIINQFPIIHNNTHFPLFGVMWDYNPNSAKSQTSCQSAFFP